MNEENEAPQDVVADVADVAPVEADVPAPAPVKPWDDEVEGEARALGWKSEDEWKGEKPAGYIPDPRDFMGRLEKIGPFRKLKEAREKDRQEFAARLEAIERVHREAAKREVDRVRTEMRKAVEHGDVERWEALRAHEEKISRPQEPAPQQAAPALAPEDQRVVVAWLQSKPESFGNDPEVNRMFFQELAHIPVPQRVVEIERRLRPDATPAPKAAPVAKVDAGGMLRATPKSRFDAIPATDQAEFRKFVKQGLWKDTPEDRADYAKAYFNE